MSVYFLPKTNLGSSSKVEGCGSVSKIRAEFFFQNNVLNIDLVLSSKRYIWQNIKLEKSIVLSGLDIRNCFFIIFIEE